MKLKCTVPKESKTYLKNSSHSFIAIYILKTRAYSKHYIESLRNSV